MWDLSKHERIEMEILEGLHSKKILDHLIFCGGTMLRLCHELNRYSVDLDFWLPDRDKGGLVCGGISEFLSGRFGIRKKANNRSSIIFEFTVKNYPRSLKIEIRKISDPVSCEEKIAFSKHSSIQVLLRAATLGEMMKSKVETLLDRAEIRDVFDVEFLLRRGVPLAASRKQLKNVQDIIKSLKPRDYRITLGSLLEFKDRHYFKAANFRFTLNHISNLLHAGADTAKRN
ncbi:MAG: nucleotidyl transferase AbiEii/AbiGii toxin family protein [Candidatus Omnitrophota bacterium]